MRRGSPVEAKKVAKHRNAHPQKQTDDVPDRPRYENASHAATPTASVVAATMPATMKA
jgi:hypothetical protein